MGNIEKREAVLKVSKRNLNMSFLPNKINVILLEKHKRDSKSIGYKKIVRADLFCFKKCGKRIERWIPSKLLSFCGELSIGIKMLPTETSSGVDRFTLLGGAP
ncbi:MAG: hypothetical protein ACP5H3_03245 [Candidatus Aenigmatarchaeota archaeon]